MECRPREMAPGAGEVPEYRRPENVTRISPKMSMEWKDSVPLGE